MKEKLLLVCLLVSTFIVSSHQQDVGNETCNSPSVMYSWEEWQSNEPQGIDPFGLLFSDWTEDEGFHIWKKNISGVLINGGNEAGNFVISMGCEEDLLMPFLHANEIVFRINNPIQLYSLTPQENITVFYQVQIFKSSTSGWEAEEPLELPCKVIAAIIPDQDACWMNETAQLGYELQESFMVDLFPWIEEDANMHCNENSEPYLNYVKTDWDTFSTAGLPDNPLKLSQSLITETGVMITIEITNMGDVNCEVNVTISCNADTSIEILVNPVNQNVTHYVFNAIPKQRRSIGIAIAPNSHENFQCSVEATILDIYQCWTLLGKQIVETIEITIPEAGANSCGTVGEASLLLGIDAFENENENPIDEIDNPFRIRAAEWQGSGNDNIIRTAAYATILNGGTEEGVFRGTIALPVNMTWSQYGNLFVLYPSVSPDSISECLIESHDTCDLTFIISGQVHIIPMAGQPNNTENPLISLQLNVVIDRRPCWSEFGKEYNQTFQLLAPNLGDIICLPNQNEPYLIADKVTWEQNPNIVQTFSNPFKINPFYIEIQDEVELATKLWNVNEQNEGRYDLLYTMQMFAIIQNGGNVSVEPGNLRYFITCDVFSYHEPFATLSHNCNYLAEYFVIENTERKTALRALGSLTKNFTIQLFTEQNTDLADCILPDSPIECNFIVILENNCWSAVGKQSNQKFLLPHFAMIENQSIDDYKESSSQELNPFSWAWIFIAAPITLFLICVVCIVVISGSVIYVKRNPIKQKLKKFKRSRKSTWNPSSFASYAKYAKNFSKNEDEIVDNQLSPVDDIEMEEFSQQDQEENDIEVEEFSTKYYLSQGGETSICYGCQAAGDIYCVRCGNYFCTMEGHCWRFWHSALPIDEKKLHISSLLKKPTNKEIKPDSFMERFKTATNTFLDSDSSSSECSDEEFINTLDKSFNELTNF